MKEDFIQAIKIAIKQIDEDGKEFICLTKGFYYNRTLLHTFREKAKEYAVDFISDSDYSWWEWHWKDDRYVLSEKIRFLQDLLIEVEQMSEEQLIERIK